MRGMSRLATGATLAAAVSLMTLIVILLFLLVSLFCSLAREKRHQCRNDDDDDVAVESEGRPPRPLSFPFYGHGVLRAPTKYLLSVPNLEAAAAKQASPSPSQDEESFVRISNPMYDGTSAAAIEEVGADAGGAVFEAPKSSAPRFEGDEESFSPPLKLMKKLSSSIVQPKASSALFDGRRSLGGSTETNRPSSSSSSNSPCSSPSW
ncbi:uncharacterized protein LOC109820220 [Asparagus officinalis]|uniref:uncharacterized protein LOC109820220 n=1 Tax=Asparagus officinalis TaxID=4686 RepID=UPI00098E5999|nr:uncharacterized protein LOC109820220 [Asparagus officinalis]